MRYVCTQCHDHFTGNQISEMRSEHEEFSMHPFICPDCWDRLQNEDPQEQIEILMEDME